MSETVSVQTLQEMMVYYRARAREYDEWFYRQGRYDRGPEDNALWSTEVAEVVTALEMHRFEGDVLELAPGTGIWTTRLARTATTVTAVDAAAEMIEINRAKVASENVTYILADLFTWQPERTYDAVFCGFWLSHVPLERLDGFLASVAFMLRPGGKFFFVDSLSKEGSSSAVLNPAQPSQDSQLTVRILNDGRAFEIVKNFYDPAELAGRLARAGLEIDVRTTATYLIYGAGTRR